MSKAVTNEEVEDVLSSIRRLVSEDKRPLAGLRTAAVGQVGTNDTAGSPDTSTEETPTSENVVSKTANRFVLTPALRVLPAEPTEHLAEEGVADENLPDQISPDEGPLDLGSVARETWTPDEACTAGEAEPVASQEAPDSGAMVLFPVVPEKSEDPAMDALDALVLEAIQSETKAIEDALDEADYTEEAFWDADAADSEALAEGAQPDEIETGGIETGELDTHDDQAEDLADQTSDPTPDMPDDSHEADAAYVSKQGHVDEQPVDKEDESVDEDATLTEEEATDDVRVMTSSAPLTAKIAAVEKALRGTRQEWEPDGDEADVLTLRDAPAMAWEDDVELDARGEPFIEAPKDSEDVAEEPEVKPQLSASAAFSSDDQVMDEEALRDLVSEIVRAELQGALGERITRNVRKLVRREIHRALTAQEME